MATVKGSLLFRGMILSRTSPIQKYFIPFCQRIFKRDKKTCPDTHYLPRNNHTALAYRYFKGGNPGIIFLPGFQSNMQGVKALALQEYCREKDLSFVRFDYQGCGESSGDIRNVTFTDWLGDVKAVIDNVSAGPQILVGSSMGAWLMLLAAMERPHRIHSLVGIASSPDFTSTMYERAPPTAKEDLEKTGETVIPSEWGDYIITKKFLADITQHNVMHKERIPLTCPVRLLHGMKDASAPYRLSVQLAEKLATDDVLVILSKKGDHRLSQPQDIQVLFEELNYLIEGSSDTRKLSIDSWSSFSVYSHPQHMLNRECATDSR